MEFLNKSTSTKQLAAAGAAALSIGILIYKCSTAGFIKLPFFNSTCDLPVETVAAAVSSNTGELAEAAETAANTALSFLDKLKSNNITLLIVLILCLVLGGLVGYLIHMFFGRRNPLISVQAEQNDQEPEQEDDENLEKDKIRRMMEYRAQQILEQRAQPFPQPQSQPPQKVPKQDVPVSDYFDDATNEPKLIDNLNTPQSALAPPQMPPENEASQPDEPTTVAAASSS
jgi:hypothetical protein